MKLRVPQPCYGIELPNGRKYDANRQGVVEIDDSLSDYVRHSGAYAQDLISVGEHFNATSGTVCSHSGCRFNGFAWQKTCPRCGSDLIPE